MSTRSEIISNHVSSSNLKERIDIVKNRNMLGVEYDPLNNLTGGEAGPWMEAGLNGPSEEQEWKREYENIDDKLKDSGYPPLSDADKQDLKDRYDDFPNIDYPSAQDLPKGWGDAAASLRID